MAITIRAYTPADAPALAQIWNEVVYDGMAFPQTEMLNAQTAAQFFAAQSFTGVALLQNEPIGLYILHPNNTGRCGHQANASYAVKRTARSLGAGRALIAHSLEQARALGFRLMIFNAVVRTNQKALHLYESFGFVRIGTVPGGFLTKDNHFEEIVLFYRVL